MKHFYTEVGSYYDRDASDFDARYWDNYVLQRIRQDFREEVKRFRFRQMLEIGYGTGMDMIHFSTTHSGVSVAGIDISGEMQKVAAKKAELSGLDQVEAFKGSVEDLASLFPGRSFDMVYVFFGALNTVEDLTVAAENIDRVVAPGGKLVFSFVNKHYVAGMVLEMLKFRWRRAFSRYQSHWGGYSPSQHLPSRCYSPREVKRAFSGYQLIKQKGYSITHPAWYYHRLNRLLKKFSPYFWRFDRMLNKTFFWSWGEYTLFVFEKPDHMGQ